ncbi:hypothetical protein V6N12_010059 [Hibiscus sabdariffa]|uniref:Uncharacterized protein n=1 Tax=Hibiscus sabdariffa TaxID=183260 RepID=A0ABR2ECM7_9ROSI
MALLGTSICTFGDGSRQCESRVWPSLGHRLGRLDSPCPGGRNPSHHCRQDLFRRLASSDRYKCLARLFKEDLEMYTGKKRGVTLSQRRVNRLPSDWRANVETAKEGLSLFVNTEGSCWKYKKGIWDDFRVYGTLKMSYRFQSCSQVVAMEGRNWDRGRRRRKTMITCARKENNRFTWVKAELERYTYGIGMLGPTVSIRNSVHGFIPTLSITGPVHEGICTWADRSFPRYYVQYSDSPIIGSVSLLDNDWSFICPRFIVLSGSRTRGAHQMFITGLVNWRFTLIWSDLHGIIVYQGDSKLDYVTRKENVLLVRGPTFLPLDTVDLGLNKIEGWISSGRLKGVSKGEWSLLDSSIGSYCDKFFIEYWSLITTVIMAEEVVGLMENLNFSEEEMVDVNADGDSMLEPLEGAERWVVEKPVDFQGPFQFGEWLKVELAKGQGNLRKKPGIVYANREQGQLAREGNGEWLTGSQEEETTPLRQRDKGKTTGTLSSVPRTAKRILRGKNEVCNPIAPKKSKTVSLLGRDEDEISEATSPIKLSAPTVEAGSQPRREP